MSTGAREKLDALGLDAICELIVDGNTLSDVAKRVSVSIGSLLTWVEAAPDRSARVSEVRRRAARIWDDKATEALASAKDPFELSKAKELSHHYRWRASKIAPREFGDKVESTIKNEQGETFKVDVHHTPEEAYLQMITKK